MGNIQRLEDIDPMDIPSYPLAQVNGHTINSVFVVDDGKDGVRLFWSLNEAIRYAEDLPELTHNEAVS